jgi:hypothetical protein
MCRVGRKGIVGRGIAQAKTGSQEIKDRHADSDSKGKSI